MDIFKDRTGVYSVRKFGGYTALIILAYLIISYTIANDFKEVPMSYLISIDMIIAFYFAKDALRNVKIGTNAGTDADTTK